jgi:hypothetical protein
MRLSKLDRSMGRFMDLRRQPTLFGFKSSDRSWAGPGPRQ